MFSRIIRVCCLMCFAFVGRTLSAQELPFQYVLSFYPYLYVSSSGAGPSGDYWYFPIARPAGVSVQWMSFYVYGSNYFSQLPASEDPYESSPGQHLVAGTRMSVLPGSNSISGLGAIAGPSKRPYPHLGCGVSASYAVVERWGAGDPAIQNESCSNLVDGELLQTGVGAISDGVTYKVTVGTSDAGWIYYEFLNTGTNEVTSKSYYAGYAPSYDRIFILPYYGGISGTWSMEAWGLEYGWW